MSKLLAPNGKPSNLTPEQYKLVRSESFISWFGDWENDRENSGKVSGITKEPVVFYHSTKSNFLSKKGENIFKNPPFFFSFKKDVSDYIVRIQHQNKKGRVYTKPFFLKFHKTFDLSQVKILKDEELTRLIKKHTFYQTESDIRLLEIKLSLSKFRGNTWFLTENEDFQDYIKNKGYDSFVVYEDGDKNIAVFEPNQIKLADGVNKTFDGSNPDVRFDKGGEVYFDDLSEKSKEIIESNYDDSFGFFDFNWNNESKRENFREWLKEFEEKQFSENLDKVIGYVKSDIELIKNKNLLQLKLKAFEELIIPSLGNEVLLPKLSKFEEMVLLYSDATIESIEKGFKDAKNIIDEDGSINQSKIAPSNMFKGDYISIPAFERFVKNNPEYKGVFNDWEKIYNEEMDLSFKETYAFRYPSLEDLEYLHSELVELKDKKSKDKFNTGGEVNTGLFSQIWDWFGIKF